MDIIDLLLVTAAASFGVLGIGIVARALFRDRASGRRRCPRCWYNMRGVQGLTCPECGRTAAHKGKLFSTRRYLRRAVGGVLLILISTVAIIFWHVRTVGLQQTTPTWMYIAAMPHLDVLTTRNELRRRLYAGDLADWEHSFLLWRSTGVLNNETRHVEDFDLAFSMIEILNSTERYGDNRPWKNWPSLDTNDFRPAIDAIASCVSHEDPVIRDRALRVLQNLSPHSNHQIAVVLGACLDPDPTVSDTAHRSLGQFHLLPAIEPLYQDHRRYRNQDIGLPDKRGGRRDLTRIPQDQEARFAFLRALRDCGPNSTRAETLLREGLRGPDSRAQHAAVWALALIAPDSSINRDAVLACYPKGNQNVRAMIINTLSVYPSNARTFKLLDDVFESGAAGERIAALNVIAARSEYVEPSRTAIRTHFLDNSLHFRYRALQIWLMTGGDHETAVAAALRHCRPETTGWYDMQRVLDLLLQYDVHADELCELAEHVSTADNARLQATATVLLAQCGYDTEQTTRQVLSHAGVELRDAELPKSLFTQPLFRLAETGNFSVDVLREMGENTQDRVRSLAVQIAERAAEHDPEAEIVLREFTDHDALSIRRAATEAVRRIEWKRQRDTEL